MQKKSWSDVLSSRVLSDHVSDGFLVIDESLTAVHSNAGFAAMTGFTTEEIIGKSITGLLQDDMQQSIEDVIPSILAEEIRKLEISWKTKSSDVVPTTVSAGVISATEEDGSCVFLVVSPSSGPYHEPLMAAEQTLRENEERYRLLFENLSDGVFRTDNNGIIMMCSDTGADIFGYSREEMEGRNYGDLLHPEDLPKILEAYRESQEKGEVLPGGIEARGIRKDGTTFHFHITNTILKDNGEPVGYQSLIRDVSERKAVEEAVYQSEQRYRNLFDNSPVSMWEEDFTAVKAWLDNLREEGVTDLSAYMDENPEAVKHALSLVKIVDVNSRSVEMYEADTKEQLIENFGALFIEKTYTRFTKELAAIWDGGPDRLQFESYAVTLKGKHLHTGITWKAPTLEGKMDLSRVIVAVSDITHRMEFEEALRSSEEKYRTIVDAMEDLVFVYDKDGNYLQYFASDDRLLVVPPEEFLGKNVKDVFSQELADSFLTCFDNVRSTREAERLDYKLTIRGQVLWFSASLNLHEDGQSIVAVVRDITARKEMENELRESEERFAVFADNIPGPVFIKDEGSNMLYANKYMIETFGVQKWLGVNTLELFPKELAEPMIADDRRAMSEGPVQVLQRVPDATGVPHHYQTSKFPIVREGKPTLLGGIALDVTDRVQAEEANLEAERKYHRLYETMEDGFVSADQEGRYLEFNAAYQQLSGYSSEELQEKTFWELTPPQWHEMEKRIYQDQTMVLGYSDIYEKELLRKDGTIIPIELRITLTRDENGNPIGTWAIVRDISLRKKAEEALREERDTAQRYLDIAGAAIVVVDVDGRIHLINRKGLEILGHESSDVVGKSWFDYFTPKNIAAEEKEIFTNIIKSGGGLQGKFARPLVNKFGEERLVNWEFQLLTNEVGNVIGMIASGEDITERDRAERALRESEEQYRSTLWALSDAIHVVDEDLMVLLVNPQLKSWISGLNLNDDIAGKRLPEAFPFLSNEIFEEYEQVFQSGKILTNEERVILAGHEIITETTKVPIMREGKVVQIVTIIRDVTEARTAVDALRESEEKFRAIFEDSPIAINVFDIDGNMVAANTALLELTGVESVEGFKNFNIFQDPSAKPADLERLRRGELVTLESEIDFGKVNESGVYQSPKTDVVKVQASFCPQHDKSGALSGYIVQLVDITQRMVAEQAIRDSEAKYKQLVEQYTQGVAILQGPPLDIVFANAALARLIDRPAEELVNLSAEEVRALIHPDDFNDAMTRFGELLDGREAYDDQFKMRLIRPSGEIRRAEILGRRVDYEGGYAIQVAIDDITDRVRAEEELRDSEERYRKLVEESLQGLAIIQDGRYVYANPSFARTLGRSVGELLQFTADEVWENIFPDDRAELRRRNEEVRAGHALSPRHRFRYVREDGSIRWVESFVGQIEHEGRPAIQVLDIDITGRMMSEKALRESEAKYRQLVEQSALGIMIIEGLPLHIAFANDAMAKISGFTIEELQSLSQEQIEGFIHPEDYESVLDLMSGAMGGEPPLDSPLMIRVIRSDGRMVWVEVLGDRIEFQDRIAIQATIVDITERVIAGREKERAEQEMKTAADTSMLYLDLLGHDMRNRLQAMQMAVELFQVDETRPHAISVLDRVLELIDSSEALIDKAHATRGLLSAPMETVSLYDAVKEATTSMREKEEEVSIEVDCRTTDARVIADEYIGHLLTNVIENAIIHNPEEEKRVWVTLKEERGGFEVSVADDGEGVPDTMKTVLFDQERRYGGLGLHQAKRILAKYGGKIEVDDRIPGKPSMGALFRLWFPKRIY
ncbi:MAG: PAS domain S-box protein [Candidatus Thorarchaeota archaeon]|jgi:PAS domain S-box-containing protein